MILEKGIHAMCDLETMGHTPGSAIISMAVWLFTEDKDPYESFVAEINLDSCLKKGLLPSGGTIGWWMQQAPDVRKEVSARLLSGGGEPVEEALAKFSLFWSTHCDKNTKIWGNGADFDNPILTSAYKRCGFKETPYAPFSGRCFRTIKAMARINGVASPYKPRVAHDASEDAWAQAMNLKHYHDEVKKRLTVRS